MRHIRFENYHADDRSAVRVLAGCFLGLHCSRVCIQGLDDL
jgi:hypothetical protein